MEARNAHNCKLPIVIRRTDGAFARGAYETPTVPNSMIPGLLGLEAIRQCRGIVDASALRFYLCGPGDYKLEDTLPPGTECIPGELAPSGHLVIPCGEFRALDAERRHGGLRVEHDITL